MTRNISRRAALKAGSILVGGMASPLFTFGGPLLAAPTATGPLPWDAANTILTNIVLPQIPNRNFTVTDPAYGAVGNGTTDNTTAFQKAITSCNLAGGGHVIVPAGTYVTGAIYLKSNVDLHLNAGAVLMFSGDASKYPLVLTRYEGIECLNHSPMIYSHGETNIALTGSGILDASGTATWNKGANRAGVLEPMVAAGTPPLQRNVAGKLRSAFVEPYSCTNVLIQGITVRKSQYWQVHPTLCKSVTVDGITTNISGPNTTDGCDPECCDHVVIKNSTIKAADDDIAIKSGRDADGRRINTPCQNIVIWNNTFEGTQGAITLGSELTGGLQNIYIFNNSIVGSGVNYALFIKSNTQRGGFIKNVNIDTFSGAKIKTAVVFLTMTYFNQTGNFLPDFSGPFNLNKYTISTAPIVLNMSGLSNDKVGTFNLSNSTFTNITNSTNKISNVSKLNLTNVTINGK